MFLMKASALFNRRPRMTDTRKDLEYKKFINTENGVTIRTTVADDKEILPMPNYTIEDLEYKKFINTPDGPAIKFTNVGPWPVVQEWIAGKDYKVGELLNSLGQELDFQS